MPRNPFGNPTPRNPFADGLTLTDEAREFLDEVFESQRSRVTRYEGKLWADEDDDAHESFEDS